MSSLFYRNIFTLPKIVKEKDHYKMKMNISKIQQNGGMKFQTRQDENCHIFLLLADGGRVISTTAAPGVTK